MIRRAEHSADKRFTIISRALAQDKSLSFQARGFLLFILSKPSKWEATDANIQREGGIGKKALASILTELKAAGYLRRTQDRKRDGTFRFMTEIFEEPLPDTVPQKEPTVTAPPLAPTDNGTADNKSTRAGAGSSMDLTERKDKRTSLKKSYKPPADPVAIAPPFNSKAFLEALDRFERVKGEIRSPLTPTSREALYCKLARFDEETATIALAEAAAGGYKGVFPEKVNGNGKSNGKSSIEPDRPVWMACKKKMLPDGTWVDDK